jgi:hypothetical protein
LRRFRQLKILAAMLAIQFVAGFVLMGGALCVTDCHEDEAGGHCRSHLDGMIVSVSEEDHFGACTGPNCPCHHNPVVEWARTLVIVYEAVDAPLSDIEPLNPGAVLDILHVPLA